MGKVFAILLIVVGIWIGLEILNNGSEGAFDGLLVKAGLVEKGKTPETSSLKRSAHSVDRAYRAGANRVDHQLERAE